MNQRKKSYPFLWGAATSSYQIEGDNIHSDWWAWEQQGFTKDKSGKATDHWNRFREDLKLAADLKLNSYRFSIEWSRLEPREGEWDEAALEQYLEMVLECEKHGLIPMVTLHHFSLPQWFAEKGGFTQENSPETFLRYVAKVVRKLGSRVPLWCTLNEPMVLTAGSYLGKFMPPGVVSPKLASKVCAQLLRAHALAYDFIHQTITVREGSFRELPIQVGIAHNMLDFMPARVWHPLDWLLALMLNRFYNSAWLNAITGRRQHFHVPAIIPPAGQVKEARGRLTCDYLGINYYTKAYLKWSPRGRIPVQLTFAKFNEPVSDLGWAIHPEGLRKILRRVAKYELPILITENGIADRYDRHRSDYLDLHLSVIADARKEGIPVRGYYYWSLLDNFEWIEGYHPRFGLYHVNYQNMQRVLRKSGERYRAHIENATGFID